MAGFILNIEQASFSSTLCIFVSLLFLILVGVDKKIKFHKVIGIEHMLRMKKFSGSDTHFKFSLFIPILIGGLVIGIFKTIYTEANPDKEYVSTVNYCVNLSLNTR